MFVNKFDQFQWITNPDWNSTYVDLNVDPYEPEPVSTMCIKESQEKPIRGIGVLQTMQLLKSSEYTKSLQVKIEPLSDATQDTDESVLDYKDAKPIFEKIAHRIMLRYEHAYQQKRALCGRIKDAVYLIFGWKSERDRLHELIYLQYFNQSTSYANEEISRYYFSLIKDDQNVLTFERTEEKPAMSRAINTIKKLHDNLKSQIEREKIPFKIKTKEFGSKEFEENTDIAEIYRLINAVAFRILAGYEKSRAENRNCPLSRLSDAFKLIFKIPTERDQLHQLGYHIDRMLHDAYFTPVEDRKKPV